MMERYENVKKIVDQLCIISIGIIAIWAILNSIAINAVYKLLFFLLVIFHLIFISDWVITTKIKKLEAERLKKIKIEYNTYFSDVSKALVQALANTNINSDNSLRKYYLFETNDITNFLFECEKNWKNISRFFGIKKICKNELLFFACSQLAIRKYPIFKIIDEEGNVQRHFTYSLNDNLISCIIDEHLSPNEKQLQCQRVLSDYTEILQEKIDKKQYVQAVKARMPVKKVVELLVS